MIGLLQMIIDALSVLGETPSKKDAERSHMVSIQRGIGMLIVILLVVFLIVCGVVALLR